MNPPTLPPDGRLSSTRPSAAPVAAAIVAWVLVAVSVLGLRMLMEHRPQFVGERVGVTKAVLVQESPRVVSRKASDDIALVHAMQPMAADVRLQMRGRRDYPGLRTVSDMSGEVSARYVVTNPFAEPLFTLMRLPHPRGSDGEGLHVLASGLRLEAPAGGEQEDLPDAWLWSGTIAPRESATLEVAYRVGSLRGFDYRVVDTAGGLVPHVRLAFQREDLDSMRFESGEGALDASVATVVWERRDFLAPDYFSARLVEGRNLYTSLSQLLEMGPVISLLFLLAVTAVILARQPLSPLQVFTIAAGYGMYFPLILYLSTRFSFPIALLLSLFAPGLLLLNYARWLLGTRLGALGGLALLVLYQAFPTLAAFYGWNRGMVLLALGLVTLTVLIRLQNVALRRGAVAVAWFVGWGLVGVPKSSAAAELQWVFPAPAESAATLLADRSAAPLPLLAFEPAVYRISDQDGRFDVEVHVRFEVLRGSDRPWTLFGDPVHLVASRLEAEAGRAQLVTVTNRPGLIAGDPGPGSLVFNYRAPMEAREGRRLAKIPLLRGPSGTVRLESGRGNLTFEQGSLWTRVSTNDGFAYEIGVAGEAALVIDGGDTLGGSPGRDPRGDRSGPDLYGIGLTRADHLTVINSDGSCLHFAEFELPTAGAEAFRMRLPEDARLISVSIDGHEVEAPQVADRWVQVGLPQERSRSNPRRLTFRLGYPPVRLGFIGALDLALPEITQTVGTEEWVVALPAGFGMQILSSGLEARKAPADLGRFGDYGKVLQSHPQIALARSLAPPGVVRLAMKYRQWVPGITDARSE